jgi:hypothetical protein
MTPGRAEASAELSGPRRMWEMGEWAIQEMKARPSSPWIHQKVWKAAGVSPVPLSIEPRKFPTNFPSCAPL